MRHQAQLDIESEIGRGSTFRVRLPRERVERLGVDEPVVNELPGIAT